MQKLISSKAITLIALVITIVVMLILAGVTIALMVNGGVIGQAEKAKSMHTNAATNEGGTLLGFERSNNRRDDGRKFGDISRMACF